MLVFYKRWKQANEIQLTKSKIIYYFANNRKINKHPPSLVHERQGITNITEQRPSLVHERQGITNITEQPSQNGNIILTSKLFIHPAG